MINVYVPRENVNDDSIIVNTINFESGSIVKKGQVIVEIETSKTSIEIESPEDGVVKHELIVGAEIDNGNLLFSVGETVENKEILKPKEIKLLNQDDIKISNSARKRATELGVSIEELGPGWVTIEDIEKKAGLIKSNIEKQNENYSVKSDKKVSLNIPFKEEIITKRKQAEIKNLQTGNHHSTSSTIGIDIKVPGKRIVPAPFLFNDSISDLIVFESSKILRKYPELNASYLSTKSYGKYEDVNFGWSFDNNANLKVLAIKNSDKLSLDDLHLEVQRLLEIFESNQNIPMELLTSSTVTISDLSKTEASFIFPLINGYQSLILGVIKKSQNFFSIYATFDHRVSEGLRVAKFLSELKSRILSHYFGKDGVISLECYACEKSITEEISLNQRGFINITLPNGDEANLCRNCFDGW